MSVKSRIGRGMVLFAKAHSFTINPLLGYSYFMNNWLSLGCCACAKERKHCPCVEAVKEVDEEGKCKCGLYWKSLNTWLELGPLQDSKQEANDDGVEHHQPDRGLS
jgi:hypothetical protein